MFQCPSFHSVAFVYIHKKTYKNQKHCRRSGKADFFETPPDFQFEENDFFLYFHCMCLRTLPGDISDFFLNALGIRWIVVDEVSTVSPELLGLLDLYLRRACSRHPFLCRLRAAAYKGHSEVSTSFSHATSGHSRRSNQLIFSRIRSKKVQHLTLRKKKRF